MLLWLTQYLQSHISAFRLFDYITFRSILAALTALIISLWLGPKVIAWLQKLQIGQSVREDGPKTHLSKAGTPTMGGILILMATTVSVLFWGDLHNRYVWSVLAMTLGFGAIGWVDDYLKVVLKSSKGLAARWKFLSQLVLAGALAFYLYCSAGSSAETQLLFPFFKHVSVALGWFFIPWVLCVVVGSSNAVNLTDGLDGLAILPTVLVVGALGIFAYLTGHVVYAKYLAIPYLPAAGELTVVCAAMAGAGLGFLWFNTYPAQIFMGDVGALALGAALGTIAVLLRQEFALLIMGGIFVVETLSVILQVGSFKLRGRRIFQMAPLHHHYELKGWPEPRVIVRFWIITVVLVLIGLSTLKLR